MSSVPPILSQFHPIDWLLLCVAMLLLLLLVRRRNTSTSEARMTIECVVQGTGCAYIRQLIVPDGLGGSIEIDYLLLTPAGLVVLDIKDYRGLLYGAEHSQTWTQMLPAGSYHFANPIPELTIRIACVRELVPTIPVSGRVVFSANGRFPSGIPMGVSMLDTLAEDLHAIAATQEIPASVQRAWQQLKPLGRQTTSSPVEPRCLTP